MIRSGTHGILDDLAESRDARVARIKSARSHELYKNVLMYNGVKDTQMECSLRVRSCK